jgi:hypothetical protein
LDVIDSVLISHTLATPPQELDPPSTGRKIAAQPSPEMCFRALLCM